MIKIQQLPDQIGQFNNRLIGWQTNYRPVYSLQYLIVYRCAAIHHKSLSLVSRSVICPKLGITGESNIATVVYDLTARHSLPDQQINLYLTAYSSAHRIFMNFTYFAIAVINNLFAKF